MQRIGRPLALIVVPLVLLIAPGAAAGAIVANGDFETGNLSGWQVYNDNAANGNWFAYTGTLSPLSALPVTAPPQGRYAAIADQSNPGLHILYQDITLPAGGSQDLLSLTAYYISDAPLATGSGLNPTGPPNQQYRIDVIRPTGPIDSQSGVLASLLAAKGGDPQEMSPTRLSTYIPISFAGKSVRIRLAEVDNEDVLNASADAIAVTSNAVILGSLTRNKKRGTAALSVTVSGPGTLTLTGPGVAKRTVAANSAGAVKLLVKAVGKKKRRLEQSGKLGVKVNVTYTPPGLNPYSQPTKVKLKQN